jgi:hypothetical protein
MSTIKATELLAKYLSLSNAAEFIRSHGEEGFSFENEKLNKFYFRENIKLAKNLNNQAEEYLKEYDKLGIEVESSINEEY